MSIGIEQANKNYTQSAPYIKLIRDCVTGEPALKARENRELYLPIPSCEDETSDESVKRYNKFVKRAEYDNVPSTTLEDLTGALNRQPNNFDGVPTAMQYIADDADGDGLSLSEHIKIAQSELLQMKFCGLLAEYSDLSGLGIDDAQLTDEQVRQLGLRSSIKLYPRDSVLNWNYRRVNGVNQLAWILLREVETKQDETGFGIEE